MSKFPVEWTDERKKVIAKLREGLNVYTNEYTRNADVVELTNLRAKFQKMKVFHHFTAAKFAVYLELLLPLFTEMVLDSITDHGPDSEFFQHPEYTLGGAIQSLQVFMQHIGAMYHMTCGCVDLGYIEHARTSQEFVNLQSGVGLIAETFLKGMSDKPENALAFMKIAEASASYKKKQETPQAAQGNKENVPPKVEVTCKEKCGTEPAPPATPRLQKMPSFIAHESDERDREEGPFIPIGEREEDLKFQKQLFGEDINPDTDVTVMRQRFG